MRISDWSSDVCSSDLQDAGRLLALRRARTPRRHGRGSRRCVVAGCAAEDARRGDRRTAPEREGRGRSRGAEGQDEQGGLSRWLIFGRKRLGEGKSGYVRGDIGGRRIRKKKKKK